VGIRVPDPLCRWSRKTKAHQASDSQSFPYAMNNRRAVSVGYLTRVHRAALSVLVNEMDAAGALADWVGSAAAGSDEAVQRAVVETAFGAKAVRSVPEMGRHSFDDDARETVGATIINVRQCGQNGESNGAWAQGP
jgi:hypothetical protein